MMMNLPCLMGSWPNFLRPTCSYTECWLSFLTRSCLTEWTSVSYSSCLSWLLPTSFICAILIKQWTRHWANSPGTCLLWRRPRWQPHRISGSFQNPAQPPALLQAARQGSGTCKIVWIYCVEIPMIRYAAVGTVCGSWRLMSRSIFAGS